MAATHWFWCMVSRASRKRSRSLTRRRRHAEQGDIIEVRGAENVARRAMAFSQLGLDAWPARVNGVGWVSLLDGEVFAVAALTLHNGRMATMDILLELARLARLDLTDLDSEPRARGAGADPDA
jgi:hypothetical protein